MLNEKAALATAGGGPIWYLADGGKLFTRIPSGCERRADRVDARRTFPCTVMPGRGFRQNGR